MANERLERYTADVSRERERPRGRGGFINYYEDQGFSSTEEFNKNWKAQEKAYGTALAESEGKIKGYEGEVATAKKGIDTQQETLNKYKSDLETNMIPVFYYDKGGNVIGKYNLPRETAITLRSTKGLYSVFTKDVDTYNPRKGSRGLVWNPDTGRMESDPRIAGMDWMHPPDGDYTKPFEYIAPTYEDAKALHIASTKKELSNPWRRELEKAHATVGSQLTEAQTGIAKGQTSLNEAYGVLSGRTAEIEGLRQQNVATTAQREAQKVQLKADYRERLNKIKEVLGGISVESK